MDNIRFNSEGGIILPNGQVIPNEEVEKKFISFIEMALMFRNHGTHCEKDRSDIFNTAIKSRELDAIDKGNIERIANSLLRMENTLNKIEKAISATCLDFRLVLEKPVVEIKERKKMEKEERRRNKKKPGTRE